MNSGTKPGQGLVTNGVPHGSAVGQIVFNFFINDISDGIKCALSQSAENMVLGGVHDASDLVGLLFEKTSLGWRNGQTGITLIRVQQRKMPNPRGINPGTSI